VESNSQDAVLLPRHYFPDSIYQTTKRGKKVTDTAWHRLPEFSLLNQQGKQVGWADLENKIIVADFFFTRCPTICPGMTQNMKRLAETIHNGQRVGDRTNRNIHFLSFSIDPERDSLQRLRYWANRFQINPETWWLLTGDKKSIYEMAINEMKLGLIDGENVDTNFVHSDKFVLIDVNRQVRGYYSGLDPEDLARLQRDIILLTMEKNPNRRSFFEGKLTVMAISFLMAILGVFTLLYFLKKNKS
jgi:protein SCO1/2